MTTPIYDFVKKYAESRTARFHMPGHKGEGKLGCECYDITEICGADILYSADGIIDESENNLTELYGTAHSFYSTEGSTLAIKAMLYLVSERKIGECATVLAARNVHASFVRAAALLDLDVEWIYPTEQSHLCECNITPEDVRVAIKSAKQKPRAVYITTPDYLGNILDVGGIAGVCRKYDIPLLVDNAHGAYLKFLSGDIHPITLGAAMCADSAHKTLPVLTGGAYLHVSKDYSHFVDRARFALSLFASTSPSYLTLASLDLCNKQLSYSYGRRISKFESIMVELKEMISNMGFEVCDSEPFKIVLRTDERLATHLRKNQIEVEFADSEYTVLMLAPENTEDDFNKLLSALYVADKGKKDKEKHHIPKHHDAEMTIRNAIFAPNELVSVENSIGRISAAPTVSCPPAVPIVISGERITEEDVRLFKHYGIEKISVVI